MGCAASTATPSVQAAPSDAQNEQHRTFPGESNVVDDTERNGGTDSTPLKDFPVSSGKYTPRDVDKRPSITQGTLLSMAMESDLKEGAAHGVLSSRPRAPSHVATPSEDNDQYIHEMPDVAYSMRVAASRSKQEDGSDVPSLTTGPNLHSGLSKNVVVNRPTVRNLQPGGINTDFSDQHGGHVFVPMQSFGAVGAGGPRGMPFVSMQQTPHGAPVHPLPLIQGYPHGPFHLAPLDPNAQLPAIGYGVPLGQPLRELGNSAANVMAGRGRGRGLPTIVVGPASMIGPGGFRGPTGGAPVSGNRAHVPIAEGRGRGNPLQILIPGSQNSQRGDPSRLQLDATARSHRADLSSSTSRANQAVGSANLKQGGESDDEEDDDNDDLVEDDEEVEDWGLDTAEPDDDEKVQASPPNLTQRIAEPPKLGPTKKPPTIPPGTQSNAGAGRIPPATKKKFRPAFEIADDSIELVDSGSDGDADSDDDDDDDVGGADDELTDWLDTARDPGASFVKSSRNTLSSRNTARTNNVPAATPINSRSSTPQTSPVKSSRVPPSSSPTHRQVPVGSPHLPLPSQQASLRQLHAIAGTGQTSPTRPAGPPPIGSSPVKPPSYRSNIVTNGMPPMLPHLNAVASPQAATGDQTTAGIRDTKVVKRKKAELPQANLPHPTPKFGDWLNSRVMINNYIILESLGAGSYAEVKLCKEKVTGKLFAMKFINRDIMKKDKLGKQSKLDDIKREIAIMKKLSHPNVLRLYEVMDDPSMNKLFLVLEYMKHGDLLSHQKKKNPNGGNLHDRDLHCVTLQVILGLAYLHEQKIVHGDIKPQNLLVGDRDVVKIADFGISQSLYGSKQKLSDTAGTPAFMSPEMCSGQEYSGQLADIWAVGATVFMLKFGQPPFVAKSAMQMFERIQNDPLVFPGPIDPLLEDLLRGMLTKNPLKRTTLLQIMTHQWVTKEEHPSHFVLAEKTPQITVTNDEVENAIDAGDKFAIIVNIRVQMMKRLQIARGEILNRQKQTGETDESHAASYQMLVANLTHAAGNDTGSTETTTTASTNATKKALTKRGTKRSKTKVFVDAGEPKESRSQKILSTEEIQYRSQLFSRKKASGVAGTNGASSAAFPRAGDHDEHTIRGLEESAAPLVGVSDESVSVLSDDDDDDDDEQAVSQSPQLLDELLLTTLSMPPLSKSSPPTDTSTGPVTHSTTTTSSTPPSSSADTTSTLHSSQPTVDTQSFHAENRPLNISIAVASLQGRRNTQEDRWTVVADIDSTTSSRWSQSLFAGLYDGHGGEECANILQDQFHAWLFRAPDELFASPDRLQQCFLDFDSFLCDFLLHKGDLSGSTATCLLVDHTGSEPERGIWNVLVGHVGDCRLLLTSRHGAVRELTSDHRLTLTAERERVVAHGGRVVNNRVNGVMAITRAFGDLEFKGLLRDSSTSSSSTASASTAALSLPDAVQASPFQREDERTPALLTARPDVHWCRVDASRHEFLILACDGLWDVMTSDEAAEILRDRVHFHGNLALAAKELAQEGIRRFSNDNISVLVVRFPMPGG